MDRRELSLRRREVVDSQKFYYFDNIGYYPHEYQLAFHLSRARNRSSCAGRRGGKSASSGHEASAYMAAGPYSICLVGPTYEDTDKEFTYIVNDIRHEDFPHYIERMVHNTDAGNLYARVSNGARVIGKSTVNVQKYPIIGDEYDLIILCEGAKIKGLGGEGGLWETQLKGNLATRRGDLIIPTTPSGRDDWLFPRFKLGLSGDDPDWFSIQWPSWANPTFLEDPLDLMRTMSWRAFCEQYLGDFVSWAGSIWLADCGFDPKVHVIQSFPIPWWWNRVEVIDPGFADYFFWIAAVMSPDGTIYVIDEFKEKRTRYRDLAARIVEHRERAYYGREQPGHIPVYVDPEDPRCRLEIMAAAAELDPPAKIVCVQADNNVWSGFQAAAANLMSGREFIFDTCPMVINALENHEWSENYSARGNRVEKRDEWKHASDVMRYLQLSKLRPSVEPTFKKMPAALTGNDLLYNTPFLSAGLPFGSSFEQFEKYHAGVLN